MFNYPPMNPGYVSSVPYYRPPQMFSQPMQQPVEPTGLIKVNGRAGADAFQMPGPNMMTALFDANEDKFYLKMTDGAGYPTIEEYSFARIDNSAQTQGKEPVYRDEFDTFKNEVKGVLENVKQLVQGKGPAV